MIGEVNISASYRIYPIAAAFLLLLAASCGMVGDSGKAGKSGDELTTVNLQANLPGGTESKASRAPLALPTAVGSVVLEARTPDCADPIAYTETQNVTAGQTDVTFSFTLPSGTTACFIVRAYSGSDGAGTLVYEGTTSGVLLDPDVSIPVTVNMDFVGTVAPNVTTNAATSVTSTGATIQGLVNPNGFETVAYFEWRELPGGGLSGTPVQPIGAGNADVAVIQVINGLTPGTDYEFRAVGSNSGNLVYGSFLQFTTPVTDVGITITFPTLTPPTVTTQAASGITTSDAQLNATVNPEGTDTYSYFEWGTDTTYGNSTPIQNLGNGTADTSPFDTLAGLAEATTYHYRAVAYNAAGITYGADQSFITGTTGAGVTPGVSSGSSHTLAVRSDGTVWAWGDNSQGQLGDGTTTNRTTPVQVQDPADPTGYLQDVSMVAGAAAFSVALKTDGTVWAWGYNNYGSLGDGTTTASPFPVQVKDSADPTGFLTDVDKIAGSLLYHTLALKNDGTVWVWGFNSFGQLGATTSEICATFPCSTTAIQVAGLSSVISISGGREHSVAVKSDGTVWAWGRNSYGEIGDATVLNRSTPVQVHDPGDQSGFLSGVIAASAGSYHTLAIKSDLSVRSWGRNDDGELGNGLLVDSNVPVQVVSVGSVGSVDGGVQHSMALLTDGTVRTWGGNINGQLGDGTTTGSSSPVQVQDPPDPSGFLTNVVLISRGSYHSIAVKADGTVWAWGYNQFGQLGNGLTTDSSIPVQVTGLNLN
jgi:alpha-tubulin suppressor-like RCC1 family protein